MRRLLATLTAETDRTYTVRDITSNSESKHTGKKLLEGITINLEPGSHTHLIVR